MDPNAAYEWMMDPEMDMDLRSDAAHGLIDWLDRGGFPPVGMTRSDVRAEAVAVRNAIGFVR